MPKVGQVLGSNTGQKSVSPLEETWVHPVKEEGEARKGLFKTTARGERETGLNSAETRVGGVFQPWGELVK